MKYLHFLDETVDVATAAVGFYDPFLVALSICISICIACLASYAGFAFSERIGVSALAFHRMRWLASGAIAMGAGVWAMHFIAMLAFALPFPVRYEVFTTALSIAPAIVAAAIALYTVSRPTINQRKLAVGGVFMGAGIGVMHYTGMAAMRLDGTMRYDPILFLVSIGVAVVLAFLALNAFVGAWKGKQRTRWQKAGGAVVMGLAISGMHYTAMAATYFFPGTATMVEAPALNPTYLAYIVGLVTASLIALLGATTAVGRRLEVAALLQKEVNDRVEAQEALKESEAQLREILDKSPVGVAVVSHATGVMRGMGKPRYVNHAIVEMFGNASPEEMIDGEFSSGWVDSDQLHAAEQSMTGKESLVDFEVLQRRKDGTEWWALINSRPIRFQGQDCAMLWYFDVTKRRQAEEALRDSERRFRTVVDNLPSTFAVIIPLTYVTAIPIIYVVMEVVMTKMPTVQDFFSQFPDDDTCLEHLFKTRFGTEVGCPKCGEIGKFRRLRKMPAYTCNCGHHIHPMAGTPFENSRTSLQKWFYAMYLFTTSRHGVPAKELQRQLGVTYKTAWRIGHELRKYMARIDGDPPLGGHVEADETYIGGKPRKHGKRGEFKYRKIKTTVFGMVERGGDVVARVVPDAKRATLIPHIKGQVEKGSTISTDEYHPYWSLPEEGYKHLMVKHREREYVNGAAHTNTLDGFWSMLKRGIRGTHVHVSRKHLQKYLGEFEFRYNLRKHPHLMFDLMLASF